MPRPPSVRVAQAPHGEGQLDTSRRHDGDDHAGVFPDDLTEVGIKVGLFGEQMPAELRQMSFLVGADDPLAELQTAAVPEGALQSLSRLLIVEALVGSQRASAIEKFALRPSHSSQVPGLECRYSAAEQLRCNAATPW